MISPCLRAIPNRLGRVTDPAQPPTDIENEYRARLADRRAALAARERTHAAYGYARLAVFASALLILFIGGMSRANWLLAPFGAFIVLIVAHARVLNARDRAAFAVGFYERGLARLAHRWIGQGRDGRHLAPTSAWPKTLSLTRWPLTSSRIRLL